MPSIAKVACRTVVRPPLRRLAATPRVSVPTDAPRLRTLATTAPPPGREAVIQPTPDRINSQRLAIVSLALGQIGIATGSTVALGALLATGVAITWGLGTTESIVQIRIATSDLKRIRAQHGEIDAAVTLALEHDSSAEGVAAAGISSGAQHGILHDRAVDAQVTRAFNGYCGAAGTLLLGSGLALNPSLLGMLSGTAVAAGSAILITCLPFLVGLSVGMGGLRTARAHQALQNRKVAQQMVTDDVNVAKACQLLDQRLRQVGTYNAIIAASHFAVGAGIPATLFGGPAGLIVLIPAALGVTVGGYLQRRNTGYDVQLSAADKIGLDTAPLIAAAIVDAHFQYAALKALKATRRDVFPWGSDAAMGWVAHLGNWLRSAVRHTAPASSAEDTVMAYATLRGTERVDYEQDLATLCAAEARDAHDAGRAQVLRQRADEHLSRRARELALLQIVKRPRSSPVEEFETLSAWLRGIDLDAAIIRRLAKQPPWDKIFAADDAQVWSHAAQALRRMDAASAEQAVHTAFEVVERELLVDSKRRAAFLERELLDFFLAFLKASPPAATAATASHTIARTVRRPAARPVSLRQ